ncbi:MAG: DEAD/DEAH box helicase, partial [Candidatus Woesearchaeota archaeon]
GKTLCALMLAVYRLKQYPGTKVLFLAPTRPLVLQHKDYFENHVEENLKIIAFTGFVSPEKRKLQFKEADIIISTPQGLENDLINENIDVKNISLLILDEAHRATGDYSYVFIAKQYHQRANFPKILALTASPGSNNEKINEIMQNLFIEKIEVRTPEDVDVKQYIQEIDIDYVKVKFPEEFRQVKSYLDKCMKSKIEEVKGFGYLNSIMTTKTELLKAQAALHAEIAKGNKDFEVLKSISLLAEALKVSHALDLIETQGVQATYSYLCQLDEEALTSKTKAVKNLVRDTNFRFALVNSKKLYEAGIEHPKLTEAKKIVKEETAINQEAKIIVFTQFRDTAVKLKEVLGGIKAEIFVGQAKKKETGLSQKEQKEMLDRFRNGEFNVLIATSVAEEGIDVPAVDLVLFYEPIPSAIRSIQRRGRTGRSKKGRVIMLITENTRDEIYRWSAHHKEKKMYRNLEGLKKNIQVTKSQPSLKEFVKEKNKSIIVFADYREKGSGVIKQLIEMNVSIKLDALQSADYVVSSRCGIEYKTKEDFVNSIIDGRLLEQLSVLKRSFERPIVLIEGENLYNARSIHPNAIRGMLATIAVSYGIPVIFSQNSADSAGIILATAKREQEREGNNFSPASFLKPKTLKEQQEYVISSFPNIGIKAARELLKEFGNIKKIINASEEELKKVSGVGEVIAKKIKEISEQNYKE